MKCGCLTMRLAVVVACTISWSASSTSPLTRKSDSGTGVAATQGRQRTIRGRPGGKQGPGRRQTPGINGRTAPLCHRARVC